jgi:hypothetical protein
MTRRTFFRGIATVFVGVGLSAKTIQELVGPAPLQDSVLNTLTKAWNAHMKGLGVKRSPNYLIVGQDLFEGFEGELQANQRWVVTSVEDPGFRSLWFKGIMMISTGRPGWDYKFVNELERNHGYLG